ncbi:hypothetical protein GCM10027442_34620 [Emticicia fontis]
MKNTSNENLRRLKEINKYVEAKEDSLFKVYKDSLFVPKKTRKKTSFKKKESRFPRHSSVPEAKRDIKGINDSTEHNYATTYKPQKVDSPYNKNSLKKTLDDSLFHKKMIKERLEDSLREIAFHAKYDSIYLENNPTEIILETEKQSSSESLLLLWVLIVLVICVGVFIYFRTRVLDYRYLRTNIKFLKPLFSDEVVKNIVNETIFHNDEHHLPSTQTLFLKYINFSLSSLNKEAFVRLMTYKARVYENLNFSVFESTQINSFSAITPAINNVFKTLNLGDKNKKNVFRSSIPNDEKIILHEKFIWSLLVIINEFSVFRGLQRLECDLNEQKFDNKIVAFLRISHDYIPSRLTSDSILNDIRKITEDFELRFEVQKYDNQILITLSEV